MTQRNAAVQRALNHFARAPFEPHRWALALSAVAEATEAALGQLVAATDTHKGVSRVSPGWEGVEREWLRLVQVDQVHNPIFAQTARLQMGRDIADFEVDASEKFATSAFYNDFHTKYDVPHVCNYKLLETADTHWILSTIGTRKQGPISGDNRRTFRLLGRAAATSVQTAIAIGDYGASLLVGAFDGISLAAFFCDRLGRVRAMTQAAESIIRNGEYLTIRAGILGSYDSVQGQKLAKGIASKNETIDAKADDCRGIALYNRAGKVVATARLIDLPQERCGLGFDAEKLVIISECATVSMADARRSGLSDAELEVAAALLKGAALGKIARERAVSIETIRTQAKSIYSKMEVCGQRELMTLCTSARILKG